MILTKGSPLNIHPERLSVMSYNILAPLYVRPVDKRTGLIQAFAAFGWADSEVLAWESRRPKVAAELKAAAADIICLQEVQFEPSPSQDEAGSSAKKGNTSSRKFELPLWLREALGSEYDFAIPAQSSLAQIADRNRRVLGQLAPIGNAIGVRRSRLELLPTETAIGEERDANTRVAVLVRGRPTTPSSSSPEMSPSSGGECGGGGGDGALAALGPTAVVSVHLDATREEKRVKQLSKCLAAARRLGTRQVVRVQQVQGEKIQLSRTSVMKVMVIIAGDMNAECFRGSCVAELLARDFGNEVYLGALIGGASGSENSGLERARGEPGSATAVAERRKEATPWEIARECASALRLTDDGPSETTADAEADVPPASQTEAEAQSVSQAEAEVDPSASPAGPSAAQLAEWNALRQEASRIPSRARIPLARAPTGYTRAVHDHGQTSGPCRSWRLDHIFFTDNSSSTQSAVPSAEGSESGGGASERGGLTLAQVWSGLEAFPDAAAAGLPCLGCPSDHLPVAATFTVAPVPALSDQERVALRSRWQTMEHESAQAKANLEADLDAAQADLTRREAEAAAVAAATAAADDITATSATSTAAATTATCSSGDAEVSVGNSVSSSSTTTIQEPPQDGKKSKKKQKANGKKGRPSEAAVALLRLRREKLKVLAAQHDNLRDDAIVGLTALERDVAEDEGLFGLSRVPEGL